MPKHYSKEEVTQLVYSQTITHLRHESLVDVDETQFIELAMKVQEGIAQQLEADLARALGHKMQRVQQPKCGCTFVHTCNNVC